jgi:cation-transporting ATPase 13A3/4/5
MRYIYNPEKACFEPYEFDLGSTNKKLQAWSGGITTDDAKNRLSLLGPNIIQVNVPTIPLAIVQE